MRTLGILLIVVASGALAQEPAAPPGRFYGPLIPKGDAPKLLPPSMDTSAPRAGTPLPTVSRCAIPLIEMKAPAAVDPAFQLTPRLDRVEPMPQAKLPPACEVSPAR